MEIEKQQALGTAGLLDEDCYLGECNLGDLEDTSGIMETYWLLAIKADRRQVGWRYYNGRQLQLHPPQRDRHLLYSKQQLYGCKAIRTQVKVLEGDSPYPVVPTAMLFGLVPSAYGDSYYGYTCLGSK
jgi:hypothetical protein